MKEKIKSIALLQSLTNEQVDMMEASTEVIRRKKGEKLFKVGHSAKDIFILLDGKVSIQVQLSSRPEIMSIVVLEKNGQLVGWSGLIEGSHYTATGVCLEDSQLLKIEGQQFLRALQHNAETGFTVMHEIAMVISQRLRNLQSVVLKTI